jgi:hypothetical protein
VDDLHVCGDLYDEYGVRVRRIALT